MQFDEWVTKYKPIQNEHNPDAPYGGTMYETVGEEYQSVLSRNTTYVWSLVEHSGKSFIISGLRFVNRLGYFITEVRETAYLEVII